MTDYELYINGELCDLSADEAITLRYQSPIFSGLDIIQSNRSYEIRLPLTSRNRKAIGFAERLDIDAEEPYKRLPAALYQEGVPLFTTGYAVIIEISDVISAVLTWGNVDNFQPLFDANLQELDEQLGSDKYIGWDENTKILAAPSTPDYPAVAFWGIDFGMGISNPKYLHPSITVSALLTAIEGYNGITIEGKERLAESHDLPLILPLVTKKGDAEVNYVFRSYTGMDISGLYVGRGYVCLDGRDNAGIISEDKSSFKTQGIKQVRVLIQGDDGQGFSVKYEETGMSVTVPYAVNLYVNGYYDNGGFKELYKASAYRIINQEAYFFPIDGKLEVEGFDSLRIEIEVNTSDPSFQYPKRLNGYVEIWGDYPKLEAAFPGYFPIAKNLPDMTQGDFVLTFMAMFGLFAYADRESPNTIKLISIEDILGSQGGTIDWSDKVLLNDGHDVSRPDSSVFTLADFAQRNLLDYDNDDDVTTDTHGLITVRNENIEKETNLVELPFSASETTLTAGVSCAIVPLYEKRDNAEDEVDYSDCDPRILAGNADQTYNGGEICTGRFETWMKFGGEEGLLATYYGGYQRVVDRIRIVTLRAKLTALDLMQLDYTKPVYISQFGQAFALYSVETGEDGICDCELIHLRGFQPIVKPRH